MNKKEVLQFLRENGLEDVEEISAKNGLLVVRFFYEFDEDELEAARGYANDESEEDEDGDSWREEYYLPYLDDIATDNVGEIIEEVAEEFNVIGQYVSYDSNEENRCEFIGVFSNEDFDIEEVLEELDL
ncbi:MULTISPECIES: hypothetical protein [Clostridium]|uniref:Uncharacterized protein n=2 Tax=Clostridium TaxID=1485 RepID=A0A151ARM6_9CLOT|nr:MULTISPECIES: hypothetical protein [Clostridium]KYH30298.1 hypothetical protein CLCOL_02440 [Clostridium colicanis DSM 13634]MBE6044479.1 hypothetical protein [Clostridium thermopalmarium]PRR69412.1 hypothetical protein CPAL_24980 [Clostridium thermopalmarium DSM 5974]PVZ26322.1 hypothetical protein LX19_00818 [Clostridium thermopalmarium DSM 5974]